MVGLILSIVLKIKFNMVNKHLLWINISTIPKSILHSVCIKTSYYDHKYKLINSNESQGI